MGEGVGLRWTSVGTGVSLWPECEGISSANSPWGPRKY